MQTINNKYTPKLRFPEFKGEWEEKKLNEIAFSESSNLALNKLEFKDVGFPVYGADGFLGFIDEFSQAENYIAIVKDGSGVGKLFFYNDKSSILGTLNYIKSINSNKYNLKWLYYSLHRFNFSIFVKGSGIPHIYFSDYGKENIKIPPLPEEQQKIASCLSSIDERIEAENQKLQALKQHKKGLMQKLFPNNVQTLHATSQKPKLRFKGFTEHWEEKKLIDVTNKKEKWSFIGGPFGSNLKSSDYVEDGIRIIQLQNIGDGEFIDNYKIYTSEEKADELLSCNIYPGDIIMSKMGDPVGRACIIPNISQRFVMCSDGIRVVVNEKRYSKYFIYLYINSIQFRSLIEKTATGSTRKRIGLNDLKNLPMIVPEKLEEQQKIATCLSSLDEIIELQGKKIEKLKEHKKGLMQQMFP